MKRRGLYLAAAAAAVLGGCIAYPPELLENEKSGNSQYALIEGAYPGLDTGASEVDSLHFKVHAYGAAVAQQTSDACEQTYIRLLTDTGLYTYVPRGIFDVVVYGSQDEYRKKTGQPDWSAGTFIGVTIYTFYSPIVDGVVAHQLTHMIWLDYMGGRLGDPQRWINEGLAVYEDSKSRPRGGDMFSGLLPALRTAPMPIDQLENMAPNTERAYDTSLWYAESVSLVAFMIEHGGRIGFGQFLTATQQGQPFDAAIYSAYPGQWHSLEDVFNAWKASLQ